MTIGKAAFFLASLVCTGPVWAQDAPALPDPAMTPGAVDLKAPPMVFCNHPTKERRQRISSSLIAGVAAAYNIPVNDMGVMYQLDHLVPLSIGGANVVANLWPQPVVEAEMIKDVCDKDIQTLVCHGKVPVEEAQKAMAENWVEACRRYGLIK